MCHFTILITSNYKLISKCCIKTYVYPVKYDVSRYFFNFCKEKYAQCIRND